MNGGSILISRAGPLATIQDEGRFGMLRHGISASGPMDRAAFHLAGALLDGRASAAVEFTQAGLSLKVQGVGVRAAVGGGKFSLHVNGKARPWQSVVRLRADDELDITPGPTGNYGYLRFDRELDIPPVLGSRATNTTVSLGGFGGRALRRGDRIGLAGQPLESAAGIQPPEQAGPIRFIWGLHADLLNSAQRAAFLAARYTVSLRLDRMGIRLADEAGALRDLKRRSLVSDAVVPGDLQVLGDGTPIVLMRDHQPTGGYPRIATVISADLDRLAQLRPGTRLSFEPVSLDHVVALRTVRT